MQKVTVLLPLYNENINVVELALGSILGQSFREFRVFVALDNPDNIELLQVVKGYKEKDSRIYLFVNEKNLGLPATLNKMIQMVETKYIARMDADDISLKNRLQLQYDYMEQNSQIDLCGSNIFYLNDKGVIKKGEEIPLKHELIKECLKYKNCMAHPTYFVKTEVMRKVMYRDSLYYAQDYDFVCRCVEQGYILANLKEYLLVYRIGTISDSKLLRQNMTAYYVKKYYRRGQLSEKKEIADLIETDIRENIETVLIKKANLKRNLLMLKESLCQRRIRESFKYVKYSIQPHKYQIDNRIGILQYKFLISKNIILLIIKKILGVQIKR